MELELSSNPRAYVLGTPDRLVFNSVSLRSGQTYFTHESLFSEFIARRITFQLHKNICLEIIFQRTTSQLLFCDSENGMEHLFGNYLFVKFHFSCTKECVSKLILLSLPAGVVLIFGLVALGFLHRLLNMFVFSIGGW